MQGQTDQQIRERAHQLWEAAGKPEGREQDFWLQAERQLKAETNPDEKSKTFVE